MRKKLMAGAAILALLMNSPQVKAEDDIVVFGSEFDKPISNEELGIRNEEEPLEDDDLGDTLIFDDLSRSPEPKPPEPKPIEPKPPEQKPIEQKPIEQKPIEQKPIEQKPAEQPTQDLPQKIEEPINKQVDEPFQPTQISNEWQERVEEPVVVVPVEKNSARESSQQVQPQQKLKMLKPRFVKLAVDDTYVYYLDKNAVEWKKMPYSSTEYMADVWIRMVEREPKALDDDMAAYGADNFRAQIELAREQGYQYPPEDIKVLSQQAYILEHYYLRPKTRQVQFLCELEVFGRPQNTINERAYDAKNWENLVPGSVESTIYDAAIKILGKGKASERGHMTFIDMLEEYGRISLR